MPLPLPPPTSPEANLADIVKGRHGLTDVVDVKTTVNTSKAVESKPLLSPVSTAPSKSVSASVQIPKPDTRVSMTCKCMVYMYLVTVIIKNHFYTKVLDFHCYVA